MTTSGLFNSVRRPWLSKSLRILPTFIPSVSYRRGEVLFLFPQSFKSKAEGERREGRKERGQGRGAGERGEERRGETGVSKPALGPLPEVHENAH